MTEKKQNSIEELKKLLKQKNRELEIEAALERVQLKTMAMPNSDKLREVVALIYKELEILNIDITLCLIIIYDWKTKDMEWWSSGPGQKILPQSYRIPISEEIEGNNLVKRFFNDQQKGIEYSEFELSGEVKRNWDEYIFKYSDLKNLPKELRNHMLSTDRTLLCDAFMSCGTLEISTQNSLTEEEIHILKRFAKAVDLTFNRVREIQKAEEQAREAQIQAALERIRSRAIGMQSSEELIEVVNTMREQMTLLGQQQLATTAIHLYDLNQDTFESWYASVQPSDKSKKLLTGKTVFSKTSTLAAKEMLKMYHSEQKEYTLIWRGKKHVEWMEEIFSKMPGLKNAVGGKLPPQQISHYSEFTGGAFVMVSIEKQPSEESKILQKRTAAVFDLAYRRFLDLKNAEVQAREAKIEAALERVRASSMAMHKTDELNNVLSTMFTELKSLEFELARCVIWIYNKEDKSVQWYRANAEAEIENYLIPYTNYKVIKDYWKAWEERTPRMYYDLSGDLKKGMDEYIFNHTEMANMPEAVKEGMIAPEQVHIYNTFNDFGVLFVPTIEPQEDEIFSILERFGNVFNQSYVRFLDLKKAEVQAREAEIQLALERIRARSMAMQKSEELREVVQVMYNQVGKLGISNRGCFLMIFDDVKQNIQCWLSERAQAQFARSFNFNHQDHEVISKWWKFWKSDEKRLSLHFKDKEKFDFDSYLFTYTGLKEMPEEVKALIINVHEVYF